MRIAKFLAVAALVAAPAYAQPPAAGLIGFFLTPSILCDTSAQLRSIVTAFEHDAEVGRARFVQLFQQLNDKREPTCAVTAVQGVALDSTELGRVNFGENELYGWMIHVENDAGAGYFLYLETPAEALKNTI
jgi:hypothetical protein